MKTNINPDRSVDIDTAAQRIKSTQAIREVLAAQPTDAVDTLDMPATAGPKTYSNQRSLDFAPAAQIGHGGVP